MKSSLVITLGLLAVGCASAPPTVLTETPDHIIAVAEENSRIGEQTFASQDPNAIRAALAGACAKGCESVEIRPTPTAPYRAIRAVYDAAVRNDAARLQLRGPTALAPLAAGPQGAPESACDSEVVLRRDGVDVYVDGRVLEPQDDCVPWGATACTETPAEPTTDYQWAGLRSVASRNAPAMRGTVCLYARDDVPGRTIDLALASIASETGEGSRFALRTDKSPSRLADERITEVVMQNAGAFTACYEREIAESPAPMTATMSFLIQTDGRVASARVTERQGTTPRFESCLTDVATAMQFPAPDGGSAILINYPLSFSPRS